MLGRNLEVQRDVRGEARIFSLSGSLFGNPSGYAFQEEVRKAVADGARKIVVELGAVDKIDSSGVGILVSIMWSASQAGAALVLAAIPPKVENVLSIAMLLDHVEHAATLEAALKIIDHIEPRTLGS